MAGKRKPAGYTTDQFIKRLDGVVRDAIKPFVDRVDRCEMIVSAMWMTVKHLEKRFDEIERETTTANAKRVVRTGKTKDPGGGSRRTLKKSR